MARGSASASRVGRRIRAPWRPQRAVRDGLPAVPAHEHVPRGPGEPRPPRDGPMSDGQAALERFLRSLRARDASEHTLRSYETAVGAYHRWLDEHGADWRSPVRADLRAYLARLVTSGARSTVSQRLGAIRSFHRFAARSGLAPGDPWGSIATPRIPRRLPRVLEVEHIERLLEAIDGPETRRGHASPAATAIGLRDRAIVEVAYAA